ncbi:MAG: alpha-acetolactate decarboxylase [Roseivirga sp.]
MYRFLVPSLILFIFSACDTQTESSSTHRDEVYQYSIIKALLEGDYDGEMTMEALAKHGDFGIGTFNTLDGEMVALEGEIYQVKTDGVAYKTSPDMKTPFAVMTHFEADTAFGLSGELTYETLLLAIDEVVPGDNQFYAIRIDGEFKGLKTRSVPAQARPYRPLGEVVDGQSVFPFQTTKGNMVGFHFPEYVGDINVAGYHLHYLDDARKKGGHVLALEEVKVRVYIDYILNLNLELPANGDFHNLDLTKDRTDDLNKVEKLRN